MATSQAVRDVLDLRVPLLAELPVPTTLRCALPAPSARGAPSPFLLTTSRQRAQEAAQARVPAFTPLEYEAVAWAAQEGAAGPPQLRRWIAQKAARLGWRLTPEEAVGGAWGLLVRALAKPNVVNVRVRRGWGEPDDHDVHRFEHTVRVGVPLDRLVWTFGQALQALGAELEGVEVHEPQAAAEGSEAA